MSGLPPLRPNLDLAPIGNCSISALVDRPHEINTALGNLGSVAHTLAPKVAFRVLHLAYQVFPDSAAARGDGKSEGEQIMLARLLKGIYW